MKRVQPNYKQRGFILPVLLFTIVFVTIIMALGLSLSLTSYNLATREAYKVNAQLTADSGLDVALNQLNINNAWSGTNGEIELTNTGNMRTTYQTSILAGTSSDRKVISVTSRTYSPASAVTPKITRKYEVDIQAVTSGTDITSVVSGVGGLIMENNSKITGGDVVVNGTISMTNQSQIGTQNNPVKVRVAYQSCPIPANSTYPQVCGLGNGQPITMTNNSKIYGEVYANNQTTGTNMSNPGLVSGQTVTPAVLPTYDRTAFTVATTKNATDAGIKCTNNGTVTWPANVKIVGDIDMGNNCTINITGNVWLTGKLTTGNQGTLKISDSLGTTRPVFMIDGTAGFTLSNNGKITPNASGTGAEIRTFWSHASSGCSPSCTTVTGTALYNSQSFTTITLGNNGNAANSVFIAQWSRVDVSNNGALGAVAGQSIELENNAVINFTSSVPNSNSLTQTWVKRGYMRVYN
jgi:Tfp pilus assembly protein PilX